MLFRGTQEMLKVFRLNPRVPTGFFQIHRACSQDTVKSSQLGQSKGSSSPPPPPSDNKSYQVPEYYQHDEWSFLDLQVAMNQHRIPQPSSKKKRLP